MGLSRVDAHSAIPPPKTPISLRSTLRVSLRVYIVVSFPESELGNLSAECSGSSSKAMQLHTVTSNWLCVTLCV